MGESTTQRRARQAGGAAVETLGQGYTAYNADPLQDALYSLVQGIVEQPLQTDTAALAPGLAADAHRGARNFLNERYDQMGAQGAGYRGGSARGAEIMAGAGLGDALMKAASQLAVMQDDRRLNAATQAANLANPVLAGLYDWYGRISNAQLGQGQLLSGLAQQPSPLGSALGGVGGILGTVASTPGNILGTVGAARGQQSGK